MDRECGRHVPSPAGGNAVTVTKIRTKSSVELPRPSTHRQTTSEGCSVLLHCEAWELWCSLVSAVPKEHCTDQPGTSKTLRVWKRLNVQPKHKCITPERRQQQGSISCQAVCVRVKPLHYRQQGGNGDKELDATSNFKKIKPQLKYHCMHVCAKCKFHEWQHLPCPFAQSPEALQAHFCFAPALAQAS